MALYQTGTGLSAYVGIGTTNPSYKLHVLNGDSSYAYFGPNSTYGAYLGIGAGTGNFIGGNAGVAQVQSTNGNLHLDAGSDGTTKRTLYLQYYQNSGGSATGGINSYGTLTHTGALTVSAGATITGGATINNGATVNNSALTVNAGYNGYSTHNYYGGYYGTGGNGFDFEDQGSFMRMAQRNIRWYDWNGTGDFFFVQNGCVGIRTAQTSSVFECKGRSYFWGYSPAGGGENRFGGLDSDSSANSRAQVVLNSAYSDLVVCSSQANGNHGSTISFVTNSTANNDYRKFVINQNNWAGDASGTGGYGDRLAFQWQDGAYTNPHSYVSPSDATLLLYGRGRSIGINNIRTPGYNLHINGNDYATGGRYTSDYFRTYGGGGWYNESYGGGLYMSDTTYLRVNNDKQIYTGGAFQTPTYRGSDGRNMIDSSYNVYGWMRPYNDGWHRCNNGYNRFYFANAGRTYMEGYDGVELRRSDDTWVAIFNNDFSIDIARAQMRMNASLNMQSHEIYVGNSFYYGRGNDREVYGGQTAGPGQGGNAAIGITKQNFGRAGVVGFRWNQGGSGTNLSFGFGAYMYDDGYQYWLNFDVTYFNDNGWANWWVANYALTI